MNLSITDLIALHVDYIMFGVVLAFGMGIIFHVSKPFFNRIFARHI